MREVDSFTGIYKAELTPILVACSELFSRGDELLNSFAGPLGTACFPSSLMLPSAYFHGPGMHWQHFVRKICVCVCMDIYTHTAIHTLLCAFYRVPGCLVTDCQN